MKTKTHLSETPNQNTNIGFRLLEIVPMPLIPFMRDKFGSQTVRIYPMIGITLLFAVLAVLTGGAGPLILAVLSAASGVTALVKWKQFGPQSDPFSRGETSMLQLFCSEKTPDHVVKQWMEPATCILFGVLGAYYSWFLAFCVVMAGIALHCVERSFDQRTLSTQSSSTPPSAEDRLRQLAEFRLRGVISEAEYLMKKQQILTGL